jgi:hypothetical protein
MLLQPLASYGHASGSHIVESLPLAVAGLASKSDGKHREQLLCDPAGKASCHLNSKAAAAQALTKGW